MAFFSLTLQVLKFCLHLPLSASHQPFPGLPVVVELTITFQAGTDIANGLVYASTAENPDPADEDTFGAALALRGNLTAVGDEHDGAVFASGGAVYLIEGGGAGPACKTVPPDVTSSAGFGVDVAMWGDLAVAGMFRDDDYVGNGGAAYLLRV